MFLTHKMTFDIICTGIHSFILFSLFAFNICQSMHHLDAEQSRVNRGQSASKPSHHPYPQSTAPYLSSANMNKFQKRWNVFLFSMSSGWELLWEWKWKWTGTDILHSLALVQRNGQWENIKSEILGCLLLLGPIIHSESSFWLTIFISRFFFGWKICINSIWIFIHFISLHTYLKFFLISRLGSF